MIIILWRLISPGCCVVGMSLSLSFLFFYDWDEKIWSRCAPFCLYSVKSRNSSGDTVFPHFWVRRD